MNQADLNAAANVLLRNGGYRYSCMQQVLSSDGVLRFSFIRRKPAAQELAQELAETQGSIAQTLAAFAAQAASQQPVDVSLSSTPAPVSAQTFYTQLLAQADQELAANAQDAQAQVRRAIARWGLRQDALAVEDLTLILGANAQDATALQYRAVAHARLGNAAAAAADVAAQARLVSDPSQAAYLDCIVAAWQGDVAGLDRLRAALANHQQESGWLYNAACALAISSQALVEKQPDLAARCREEAADLLTRAVAAGYTNFTAIQGDLDLEAIRGSEAFRQVLAQGQLDFSLSGVWVTDSAYETVPLLGLDPAAHLARCRELASAGYRPISISVSAESKIAIASLWRRALVRDGSKETLAQRHAIAAVALLRLGQPEKVWPLLAHGPDPRVRSYLVHQLSPLGADPASLVARFKSEPDVTVRRALLLALGEFGGTESGAQGPPAFATPALIAELTELYRVHPDAGLHGALDWLLRRWGQDSKLRAIEQVLATGKAEGNREWYVNGQAQAYTVIRGPVEFWMGSPAAEEGREGGAEGTIETRHRRRIGRTFAIATKEVSVEDFLRFRANHEINKQYARSATDPVNQVTWYDAAAYCNWLSAEEKIPPDQWCYEPNSGGQFAEGMQPRVNYLELAGYRLPSEAEWEYACRAGAVTSRYYGETEALLPRYAWYTKNSQDRWLLSPGTLKPNDLGLFDMHGNALEWCQDPAQPYALSQGGAASEDVAFPGVVADNALRVLRGGSFGYQPSHVRSALRYRYQPTYRSFAVGLRPARTYP